LLDESFPAAMSPSQAAFLKGKAYYDATLFEDAIREYRKSRELDASLPGVQVELARALISVRDNTAAETELRSILKKQPSNPDACYLLGALLVQEGKETEAMTLLEKARAARPDGWGAYYYLGRARLQTNDAQSAAPLLEKAASLNPDESAVFYHLSRALKALGRDAEARKASARVAELKRKGMERDQDAVILR
jgi:predicted Zn-dependent protease